jgi:ubiquinone/menaquinone biosynthesis C-methylase UbiE
VSATHRQWAWYVSSLAYRFTDTAPSRAVDAAIFDVLGDRLRGARVLDCGCGPGGLAEQLARRRPARLLAVDANPAMVRQARRRLRPGASVEVRRALVDASFLRTLDETFDVIVFKRSLYASPEVAAATLGAAVGALAPGGIVIVAQPERRLRHYAFTSRPPYVRAHTPYHLANRLLSRIAVMLRISDYRDLSADELVALVRSAAPESDVGVVPSNQRAYALVAARR